MSKVLRMIDFDELITWKHQNFIIEQEMTGTALSKKQEELEDENGWDEEQDEYGDGGDFTHDDIPF